jgi:hypothetical protein
MTTREARKHGHVHSKAERRKQSAEMRIPKAERLARDREMLDALGQTKTWEYAGYAGVSEKVAKDRLRRLFELGMADREKRRGEIGWTYKAVKP